jgi:L-malate glycosyltransferase
MKIGITCYPTYGGSGVIATELGKALALKGHTVHFISYALPFRLKEFSENIVYHEVYVNNYPLFQYPPYSVTLASKMAEVISYENLDLLHVHYAIPHATSGLLAREILQDQNNPKQNFKMITTLHGTDITLVGGDPSLKGAVRLGINQSNGVTAVSEYLKQKTIHDFYPKQGIKVIPNFVDTEEFKRKDCTRYHEAFAGKGEKIVVHISNFRPLKRVKDVIRTFEKVVKEIPARLLLAGDGPERSEAEALARELGIYDKVRFLGNQDGVVELLSISDVMILPSESESFGLAALEAMSCGVPVVASRIGGLPELITEGKNGFLAPLKDTEVMAKSVLSILQSDERQKSFAAAARETALRYDTGKIIPLYENYYEEILSA